MSRSHLHPAWPTRQMEISIAGIALSLRVPDRPCDMLDLPTVRQAFGEDDYMPYWAQLWPAGLMLGQWLVHRIMETSMAPSADSPAVPPPPARALEIGCGLAAAGLLSARLGYRVTLSDYDPDAVEFARHNAQLNAVAVATELLDWRRPSGDRYPLILGGDLLYEQRSHQPILELLRLSLEQCGLAALADPCRRTADAFLRDAHAAGWQVQTEPACWEDLQGRIILLWRK